MIRSHAMEAISRTQINLLQLIAKYPGVSREKVLGIPGLVPADLEYLIRHDLIREREVGQYRIAHLGEMVLKRGV